MSSLREQVENLDASVERLRKENTALQEKYREAKEELDHYRAAVSAVKWLWDQAAKQNEFQL